MRCTFSTAVVFALVADVYGHGVLTQIQGANGVNMPGLSGKLISALSYPYLAV